jgi:glycosyltransferase involved in cell wall biosynthesis
VNGQHLRVPALVSVVAPMMNEEETLFAFYERTSAALVGYRYEIVLVDDGSTDATPRLLAELAATDERVRPVYLSRNFGHQAALTAGLDHARGDVVVSIDADLQDPPELIPRLVDHWRTGSDVVHAVRRLRHGEPRWKVKSKRAFYRVFSSLSEVEYLSDAGDFRLFDRRTLDAVLQMRERRRFIRGMAVWAGYTQTSVPYDRDPRYAGTTKYPLRKLFTFGVDGIVSFSNVPLQLATVIGVVVSAIALLLIPVVVALRLSGHYLPGVASIHILILGLGGVQLVTLGIIGVYVGRILDEVKARPIYLVRTDPTQGAALAGTEEFLAEIAPSDVIALQPRPLRD